MTYQQIGHPIDDADLLRSISPVFHADKIVAPLLIAQGTNDPRVKKLNQIKWLKLCVKEVLKFNIL